MRLHGVAAPKAVRLNGRRLAPLPPATKTAAGYSWSAADRRLTVTTPALPVRQRVVLELER